MASPDISVLSETFIPMLTRLDECIGYLESNVSVPCHLVIYTLYVLYSYVPMWMTMVVMNIKFSVFMSVAFEAFIRVRYNGRGLLSFHCWDVSVAPFTKQHLKHREVMVLFPTTGRLSLILPFFAV